MTPQDPAKPSEEELIFLQALVDSPRAKDAFFSILQGAISAKRRLYEDAAASVIQGTSENPKYASVTFGELKAFTTIHDTFLRHLPDEDTRHARHNTSTTSTTSTNNAFSSSTQYPRGGGPTENVPPSNER